MLLKTFKQPTIFEDYFVQIHGIYPYPTEEEQNQYRDNALERQANDFLDMFRAKLENPQQPLQYVPEILR